MRQFKLLRRNTRFKVCLLLPACFWGLAAAHAQPNSTISLDKPAPYQSRTLPAEKTGNKKFTIPRRLYNNTVTRYNYYFNANLRLNEIVERARAAHSDEYGQLLSFYDYDLNITAQDEIDTIIYKCTAGLLLHDLRSDWVDDLYILLGKAYLMRKDYDSATQVFQFINYAFAPKDDGYDIPLGSNASNTNGVFTIATLEKRNLWKKLTKNNPGRNESFIWQARTYLEQQKQGEAAGLLEILRSDPNFPERLQPALHELTAYWFYQQQVYDSAALYLTKALPNATTKQTAARWEYLAGQLYGLAGKDALSVQQFERAIQHTNDPLMEVYARLNMVNLSSAKEADALQKNLDELLKMAKKDKYEGYRDIIYYTAAQLELKRKNYTAAEKLLLNSVQYGEENPLQKQLGFLLLGDLNYDRKSYAAAHRFYDSVETTGVNEGDLEKLNARKPSLLLLTGNTARVIKEDSLQVLASMPETDRMAAIKKILKQLRKEKGLKDAEEPSFGTNLPVNPSSGTSLFGNNNTDFYFQSTSLRAKGLGEFRSRWGNRPNIDNWRRQNAVDRSFNNTQQTVQAPTDNNAVAASPEPTAASLLAGLPLTTEQKNASDLTIRKALLENAEIFQNQLRDYPSAAAVYEELLKRFPNSSSETEKALYQLAFSYRLNGETEKADSVNRIFAANYPNSPRIAQQKNALLAKKADPASVQYENIYRLFIEGNFNEAKEAKLEADKQFGKTYWTPQLLYIESVYYSKQRQDSLAIDRLQNIVSLFSSSAMAERAGTMIDVLKRRNEIETYLTNLTIDRGEENVQRGIDLNVATTTATTKDKKIAGPFQPKELTLPSKDLAIKPVISGSQAEAVEANRGNRNNTSVGNKTLPINSLPRSLTPLPGTGSAPLPAAFSFSLTDPHYVMVLLDKVDPVFVSEGRNAFNRYHQERYANQRISITTLAFSPDIQILLFGPFANANDAVSYVDRTRPIAASRVVPWMPADKISFNMISPANLELLNSNKDLSGYRSFIQKILPDKF